LHSYNKIKDSFKEGGILKDRVERIIQVIQQ